MLAAASGAAQAADAGPVGDLPYHVPAFRMGGGWISNLPLSGILSSVAAAGGSVAVLNEAQRLALTRYLSTLASMGPATHPELFASRADVLAYLVDAHLAWSIALARRGVSGAAASRTEFPLDGEAWTLQRIAATLATLAPSEPRLAFFLGGNGSLPPLPPTAVEGWSLDWQLALQAHRTGAAAGFWSYDPSAALVTLPHLVAGLPGLGGDIRARARRLLDLAPPSPTLAAAIRSGCGPDLGHCRIVIAPHPL